MASKWTCAQALSIRTQRNLNELKWTLYAQVMVICSFCQIGKKNDDRTVCTVPYGIWLYRPYRHITDVEGTIGSFWRWHVVGWLGVRTLTWMDKWTNLRVTRVTTIRVTRGTHIRWHMSCPYEDMWNTMNRWVRWQGRLVANIGPMSNWHMAFSWHMERCHVAQTWATTWHPLVGVCFIKIWCHRVSTPRPLHWANLWQG